jgi:hypothetical protein
MLDRRHSRRGRHVDPAVVFAALGDATRLSLIGRLSAGTPLSISRLAGLGFDATGSHQASARAGDGRCRGRGSAPAAESLSAGARAPRGHAVDTSTASRRNGTKRSRLKAFVER